MIEEVENAESDAGIQVLVRDGKPYLPGDLQVEGRKSRITLRIARSYEIAVLIDWGPRKSGVYIEDWKQRQLERCVPFAPGKEAVRSVERKPTPLIPFDYGDSVVTKELVEVVQVSVCLRSHVAGIDGGAAEFVLGS